MQRFIVRQSAGLQGEVSVSSSKNAILPMLCACLLTEETLSIQRVPQLRDVDVMERILLALGVRVRREGDAVRMCAGDLHSVEAPYDEARRMRASILCMGPLLARCGQARLSLPGGCAIGTRPVDLHLRALEALGASVCVEHGQVSATARRLTGAPIVLDIPSVGATENILLAATLAHGETRIVNAAKEPEIVDLARCLRGMGARISGEGSDTIVVRGVPRLRGCTHRPIPDRIEAGTLMIAAAITGGNILLRGAMPDHLRAVIAKLIACGVEVHDYPGGIRVRGGVRAPADIKTSVYPGFPTDLQPQMMALLCRAPGTSLIQETIFENRFMHVPELRRMGARISVDGRMAVLEGGPSLTGARVHATDLRAGAALVLAGLAAEGETVVEDPGHIDRGYDHLEEKLASLGGRIRRLGGERSDAGFSDTGCLYGPAEQPFA